MLLFAVVATMADKDNGNGGRLVNLIFFAMTRWSNLIFSKPVNVCWLQGQNHLHLPQRKSYW
jgi:hypothetical protein